MAGDVAADVLGPEYVAKNLIALVDVGWLGADDIVGKLIAAQRIQLGFKFAGIVCLQASGLVTETPQNCRKQRFGAALSLIARYAELAGGPLSDRATLQTNPDEPPAAHLYDD